MVQNADMVIGVGAATLERLAVAVANRRPLGAFSTRKLVGIASLREREGKAHVLAGSE